MVVGGVLLVGLACVWSEADGASGGRGSSMSASEAVRGILLVIGSEAIQAAQVRCSWASPPITLSVPQKAAELPFALPAYSNLLPSLHPSGLRGGLHDDCAWLRIFATGSGGPGGRFWHSADGSSCHASCGLSAWPGGRGESRLRQEAKVAEFQCLQN